KNPPVDAARRHSHIAPPAPFLGLLSKPSRVSGDLSAPCSPRHWCPHKIVVDLPSIAPHVQQRAEVIGRHAVTYYGAFKTTLIDGHLINPDGVSSDRRNDRTGKTHISWHG